MSLLDEQPDTIAKTVTTAERRAGRAARFMGASSRNFKEWTRCRRSAADVRARPLRRVEIPNHPLGVTGIFRHLRSQSQRCLQGSRKMER
jgi:hypothetical protein